MVIAVIYLKSTNSSDCLSLSSRVGHAIRKAVREVEENQARNRNSVNAVNVSFLAASMNPFGLPGQHPPPKPLGGQDDIGSLQQSLLESQAAAQSGRLLSGQQGSMFHSLMGGRGLDTFSSMTALGGAGLLKPCSPPPPSNNHPALARYSSVGAGRTPDTSTSRHDDLATSLQRMSRGGGQQQLNRSQQQLAENAISMLFSQNFSAAAPTATDQLMLNAARVQQDRRSLMAQRAIGIGIGSLGTAIRPSSRILGQEDAQMPGGGELLPTTRFCGQTCETAVVVLANLAFCKKEVESRRE